MKVQIVDSYYPAFLQSFYRAHPELTNCSYHEQWHSLMDRCFGTADFYSANLIALGHEAVELVANCEPLQQQWAKEHDVKTETWALGRRGGLIPWPQKG